MLFELAIHTAGAVRYLRSRWTDESGATAVEYGLMVALIAAVIVGIVTVLGVDVAAMFQEFIDSW